MNDYTVMVRLSGKVEVILEMSHSKDMARAESAGIMTMTAKAVEVYKAVLAAEESK